MPETEEEIEEWFEQEKQRLSEEHYQAIQHGKDLEKAKKNFDKEMQKLLKEYEKKYDKMWKQQERHEKLHEPIDEFKRKWKARVDSIEKWHSGWKEKMHDHYEELLTKANKERYEIELKWHRFLKEHREQLKDLKNKL